VHHICRTGFDGKPVPPRSKGIAPHSWPVSSDKAVPGAPIPAKSLYDVAQALSWVAGHNPTVEDQIRWTDQGGPCHGDLSGRNGAEGSLNARIQLNGMALPGARRRQHQEPAACD
jgi:hypothetical protein